MDERDLEHGYANFHRKLNRVLRTKDVRAFKEHVAAHPGQAGRLSFCLGINDELAEVEMYKAILIRSALKDLHQEVRAWLKDRGIEAPISKDRKGRRKRYRRGRKA